MAACSSCLPDSSANGSTERGSTAAAHALRRQKNQNICHMDNNFFSTKIYLWEQFVNAHDPDFPDSSDYIPPAVEGTVATEIGQLAFTLYFIFILFQVDSIFTAIHFMTTAFCIYIGKSFPQVESLKLKDPEAYIQKVLLLRNANLSTTIIDRFLLAILGVLSSGTQIT